MIIQDDCLVALDKVKPDSVDLVYLDPPFFTQKTHSQTQAGTEYVVNDVWESREFYLDYMRERIAKIRSVMKDTASIFLHCDNNAEHHLRFILDEIFGENNFRAEIIWSYRRWTSLKRGLMPSHQKIYHYSKTDSFKFNRIYTDYSPTTNIDQIMQERDRNEHGKTVYKSDEDGNIVMGAEKKGVPLSDVWDVPFLNPKAKERTGYPTQKPIELIERIIKIASDEGDVVLDPFCGSGTTLVSAKLLNREYIGIDNNEVAINITNERLKNPVKTSSKVLESGIQAYMNKSDEEMNILNLFDCVVVQRNRGIDAILKKYYLGAPVAIKIQRRDQSLKDSLALLHEAAQKRKCSFMILVKNDMAAPIFPEDATEEVIQQIREDFYDESFLEDYENVAIINRPDTQLQRLFIDNLESRQEDYEKLLAEMGVEPIEPKRRGRKPGTKNSVKRERNGLVHHLNEDGSIAFTLNSEGVEVNFDGSKLTGRGHKRLIEAKEREAKIKMLQKLASKTANSKAKEQAALEVEADMLAKAKLKEAMESAEGKLPDGADNVETASKKATASGSKKSSKDAKVSDAKKGNAANELSYDAAKSAPLAANKADSESTGVVAAISLKSGDINAQDGIGSESVASIYSDNEDVIDEISEYPSLDEMVPESSAEHELAQASVASHVSPLSYHDALVRTGNVDIEVIAKSQARAAQVRASIEKHLVESVKGKKGKLPKYKSPRVEDLAKMTEEDPVLKEIDASREATERALRERLAAKAALEGKEPPELKFESHINVSPLATAPALGNSDELKAKGKKGKHDGDGENLSNNTIIDGVNDTATILAKAMAASENGYPVGAAGPVGANGPVGAMQGAAMQSAAGTMQNAVSAASAAGANGVTPTMANPANPAHMSNPNGMDGAMAPNAMMMGAINNMGAPMGMPNMMPNAMAMAQGQMSAPQAQAQAAQVQAAHAQAQSAPVTGAPNGMAPNAMAPNAMGMMPNMPMNGFNPAMMQMMQNMAFNQGFNPYMTMPQVDSKNATPEELWASQQAQAAQAMLQQQQLMAMMAMNNMTPEAMNNMLQMQQKMAQMHAMMASQGSMPQGAMQGQAMNPNAMSQVPNMAQGQMVSNPMAAAVSPNMSSNAMAPMMPNMVAPNGMMNPASKEAGEEAAPKPVKRGRGRPPKNKS